MNSQASNANTAEENLKWHEYLVNDIVLTFVRLRREA
jgi:hypothetical protein